MWNFGCAIVLSLCAFHCALGSVVTVDGSFADIGFDDGENSYRLYTDENYIYKIFEGDKDMFSVSNTEGKYNVKFSKHVALGGDL
jgi:hypothetical protein